MFWGGAILLVVMFITLRATSFPQRDYGGQNPA